MNQKRKFKWNMSVANVQVNHNKFKWNELKLQWKTDFYSMIVLSPELVSP